MRTLSSARLRAAVGAATVIAVSSTSIVAPAAAAPQPSPAPITAPALSQEHQLAAFTALGMALLGATAFIMIFGSGPSAEKRPSPSSTSPKNNQANPMASSTLHRVKQPGEQTGNTSAGAGGQTPQVKAGARAMITDPPGDSDDSATLVKPQEPGQVPGSQGNFDDSTPIPGFGDLSVDEGRGIVYKGVNTTRTNSNTPSLQVDPDLELSANAAAKRMMLTVRREGSTTLDHFRNSFRGWESTAADAPAQSGQLLWWSRDNDAPRLLTNLIEHSQDRSAHNSILDSTFTKVGVGVSRDAETGMWFFVIRFIGP